MIRALRRRLQERRHARDLREALAVLDNPMLIVHFEVELRRQDTDRQLERVIGPKPVLALPAGKLSTTCKDFLEVVDKPQRSIDGILAR